MGHMTDCSVVPTTTLASGASLSTEVTTQMSDRVTAVVDAGSGGGLLAAPGSYDIEFDAYDPRVDAFIGGKTITGSTSSYQSEYFLGPKCRVTITNADTLSSNDYRLRVCAIRDYNR